MEDRRSAKVPRGHRTADNARTKIESLVSSAKNTIVGTYDFKQLVSRHADSDVKIPEIESKLTAMTAAQARDSFGITISQVGIERISLPEANTSFVFERMRAERSQFAERYLRRAASRPTRSAPTPTRRRR
ncbi:MAG: SPFH domain-containing protein [Verrucomicrobiota bacterium]